MFENYDMEKKNIDVAFMNIREILKNLILYQPKNYEFGIYLTNDEEDEEHKYLLKINKVSLNMVKYIDSIQEEATNPQIINGFFSDLKNSMDHVVTKMKKSKGKKKIYVFTTADFESDYDSEDIEELKRFIILNDIYVNIISFNFWNVNPNILSENQKNNKEIFKNLHECPNVKIFPSNVALLIQRQLKKKDYRAKPNYSGKLEITPYIQLDVKIYSKTKQEKLKSVQYYNKKVKFDKNEKSDIVTRKTCYFDEDELKEDELTRGFNYGEQVIPVSNELMNKIKYIEENPCLQILHFVKESDIPRHYYISEAEVIYPDGLDKNILAFNSIVRVCIEDCKLALAKYVKRKNSTPKFVVLHPYYKKKCFSFYLIELPTIEDIREYNFNSLNTSSESQRKAIKEFINKMDLTNKRITENGCNVNEPLKPKNSFNPNIQYFNQVLFDKVQNSCLLEKLVKEKINLEKNKTKNQVEINEIEEKIKEVETMPEIDTKFTNAYKINETLLEKCEDEFNKMREELALIKNEEYVEDKRQRVYWKELIKEYENQANQEEILEEEKLGDNDDDFIQHIDISHPISDFKNMMSNRKHDLVSSAIDQMIEIIKKLINDSINKNNFDKCIDCIKQLRQDCIFEEEFLNFNNFMDFIKNETFENFKQFFRELALRKISKISKEEVEGSKITHEESLKFINILIEDEQEIENNNDEIFDEIE